MLVFKVFKWHKKFAHFCNPTPLSPPSYSMDIHRVSLGKTMMNISKNNDNNKGG